MGGGSHSVDSAGAAAAKQQELAVQQKQLALASDQNAKQNALYSTLFGNGSANGGGTLSHFLDPNSLNVTSPTGVYGRQYQEGVQQTENEAKNQRASQERSMASRGFGASPAMFGADQDRQSRLAAADAKGHQFTDAVGSQYKDALSNFWNATGTASDVMRGATGAATQNMGNVGSTAASMYNTGNQQVQNSNLFGNLVGAGGQVGAAAMMCTAIGALITMQDGTVRLVEDLKKGDEVLGIDGQPCTLIDDPLPAMRECVIVQTENHKSKVSLEHTFALVGGGYDYAKSVAGKFVRAVSGSARINDVRVTDPEMVYYLPLDGSHSYCADGLWALA